MSDTAIVLITGANTGLGLQIVKALCRSNTAYTIILGARDLSKATNAIDEVKRELPATTSNLESVQIDLEDDGSIANAFQTVLLKHERIDVLINNAGQQFDQLFPQGKMSARDMWNKSWNVNVTGTYVVTQSSVPLLLRSTRPRIIFITSGTSTLTEHENTAVPVNKPSSKGWPKQEFAVTAYRSAKTGMNMMVAEWYRMLRNDGIKVFAVSPGFLATGLGGNTELLKKMGAQDPAIGGQLVTDVVEGRRDGDVGKIVRKDGVQPW